MKLPNTSSPEGTYDTWRARPERTIILAGPTISRKSRCFLLVFFRSTLVVSVEGSNGGLVSCSVVNRPCYRRTHEDPGRALDFVLCCLLPALCVDYH